MPDNLTPEERITALEEHAKRLHETLGTLITWLHLQSGGLRTDEVERLLRRLNDSPK